MSSYYIYILASKKNGTLYTGVTSNLVKRIYQHKDKQTKSFTKKYHTNLLVHYEVFKDMINAITREKQLNHWKREWKIKLIEKHNPRWKDLYDNIY